jgi:tellurite resistance protein TerC
MIDTVGSPLLWLLFIGFIVFMLAVDLGVLNRRAHEMSAKEAGVWTGVWVALALAFNLWVASRFGLDVGEAFLTGYLIEKALSVDNLFVFYLVFRAFRVELAQQHRLLFWGILGALVLRAAMIFGGTYLLSRFSWVVYVFGAVLIATGVKMLTRPNAELHPQEGRIYRFVQRLIPTTPEVVGQRLFARVDGRLLATPLFVVLLLVELTDIVFAIDSILAIFAVTTDPFIVFTSNVFAVLGMRSLYLVLATMARRFDYLQPGLALILLFVGTKMAVSHFYKVPTVVSLLVVVTLLGGSILASLVKTARERRAKPA